MANYEEDIRNSIQQVDNEMHITLDPNRAALFIEHYKATIEQVQELGYQPVLLALPELRKPLWRLLERFVDDVTVLSHREIASGTPVEAVAETGDIAADGATTPQDFGSEMDPGMGMPMDENLSADILEEDWSNVPPAFS
jgi:hypothetical protein